MPTKPLLNERKLTRSTMPNQSSEERCKILSATNLEEDNILCEITSIGKDKNALNAGVKKEEASLTYRLNKKCKDWCPVVFQICEKSSLSKKTNYRTKKECVLPYSQQQSAYGKLTFPSGDKSEKSSSSKPVNKSGKQANGPMAMGLSDRGANSNLPTRPVSTSRMLPHISRKHLHKETLSLFSKPKPASDIKLLSADHKGKGGLLRKTDDNEQIYDEKRRVAQDQERLKYVKHSGSTSKSVSALNINRCSDVSECVLNSAALQSLTPIKTNSTPPEQKMMPKAPHQPKPRIGSFSLGNEKSSSVKNLEEFPKNPTPPITTSVASNDLPNPSQSFMPIISVRNLQINNEKQIKANQNITGHGMARSLTSRPKLQSREREVRLRKTHPLILPDSGRKDLSAIMRDKNIK